ncbi:MAG: S1 RNA-binding domain-containing protein, partial [Candidatus Puniceispirillaceae bacterium]
MTKKLLIDAHQPEETRVVLLNGNKIEEFDYENTSFKQLKGNVYLARVTRVEPSLQAAFVEYGGNRQGFLAFSEIHPDYYRIPIEDREALVEETRQTEQAESQDEAEENSAADSPDNAPETLGGDDEDNDSPKPS